MCKTDTLNAAILNSLDSEIVAIHADGRIIAANDAWLDFAKEIFPNEAFANGGVGKNYVQLCEEVVQINPQAKSALVGLKSVLSGQCAHFELEYPFKIGEKLSWVWMKATPLKQEGGGAVITQTNVTMPKCSQAKHLQHDITEKVLHVFPDLIYVHDLQERRNVYVNRELFSVLGYQPEDVQEPGFITSIIHPEDYAKVYQKNMRFSEEHDREFFEIEYRIRHANGEWRFLRSREMIFARDDNGFPKQILGIAQDVTKEKQSEFALQESEERFHLLLESAEDMIFVHDKTGKILYYNGSSKYGICAKDLVGKHPTDFLPAKKAADILERIHLVFESGQSCQFEVAGYFGGVDYVVSEHAFPLQDSNGHIHSVARICRNIAHQKAMQKALQESEAQYRTLVENSLIGLLIVQQDRVLYANPVLVEKLGFPANALIGESIDNFVLHIHPEDRELVKRHYRQFMQGKQTHQTYECKVLAKDGSLLWTVICAKEIHFKGEPALQVAVLDISDRKKIERALQESEKKYRLLVENSLQGILILQHDQLLFVNKAVSDITGYSMAEMKQLPFSTVTGIIEKRDRDAVLENYSHRKTDQPAPEQYEIWIRTKQDKRVCVIINAKVLQYQNEPAVYVTLTNITEKKQIMKALQESERKYRMLVEHSLQGIFVVRNHRICFANQAATEILEYSLDELMAFSREELLNLVHPDHRERLVEYQASILRRNPRWKNTEAKILTKSGRYAWLLLSGKQMDFDGQDEMLIATIDISQQKQAESELRKSEAFLEHVIESIQDGIFVLDKHLTVRHSNSVMRKWNNHSGELIGKKCHEGYRENASSCADCPTLRALSSGKTEHGTVPGLPHSEIEWLELYSYPLFDKETNEIQGVVEFARDITERKRAENELLESEEKYNRLFQNSQDGILLHDADGRIIDANSKALQSFGYSLEELLCKAVCELHPPNMQNKCREAFLALSEKATVTFEIEFLTKNGSTFLAEVTSSQFDFHQKKLVQGIVRDITERKRAELALKQSEAKYRRLFEDAALGIFQSTLAGKVLSANISFANMFGFKSEHDAIISVKDAAQELYADPHKRAAVIQKALSGAQPVIEECQFRRKDGSCFTGILFLRAVKDELGQLTHLEGFIEDITERKTAEKALQKSQAMYKLLADNADDVIWTTDNHLNFTYVSPSVKLMYGYEPDEFLEFSVQAILPSPVFEDALTAQLLQDEFDPSIVEKCVSLRNEYEQQRKDGSRFWAEVIMRRLHNENGEALSGFIGITRDITHRKQAEEKLKASLKEKELLLRELYHRTKNNMQVISSLLALQTRHFQDPDIKAVFQDTENRIRTMALVHQKLYQSESLTNIDLQEYIEDLVALLAASYEVSANRILVSLNTEKVIVAIDFAIPCGLVLNELISNAFKHAFPGERQGRIRIGLRKKDEGTTELYVSDNGIGLPKMLDIRKTKSLGLKTIFTIVEQQLHGLVDFSTQSGVTCRCIFSNTLYKSSL
ncbi:signal transduction histidine kinase [Chloroherpeton thalassium ATCC 35110]|uniref:histidine kinase n=1 Tax=Chloroherpeton thalassium (strain ATCC 35110 / GB-78) TaxID=517418 RepID=B3QSX3_CHLT3|nr:PAS domain S-box protein [Chloroherpeton thalassium]ACF12616.1 signal transduction histidine kinase [Chloroherpeton thalassium ATCC 35110]